MKALNDEPAHLRILARVEPNRRSHTGNVFEKVYFLIKDGRLWQSLDVRRLDVSQTLEYYLYRQFHPWWYSGKYLASNAEWAYLDAPGDFDARICVIDPASVVRARIDSPARGDAERWLQAQFFVQSDPGGAPDGSMPRRPPYFTPRGEQIQL